MTGATRTEPVIPATGRPPRVRRVQRLLASMLGVVRVEPDEESRRVVVVHELADELPLVAVLAALGYAALCQRRRRDPW